MLYREIEDQLMSNEDGYFESAREQQIFESEEDDTVVTLYPAYGTGIVTIYVKEKAVVWLGLKDMKKIHKAVKKFNKNEA